LKPVSSHYCPGCGHSIVHRLIAELFEELETGERAIGVAPAGCAVLAYNYLDVDIIEAAHGRAAAVATGIKRCLPDRLVFAYQGDGDLAAIGTSETIHSATRGENITIIFINNAIYGMTGGQMAPTTLLGMKATTAPDGRSVKREGHPLDITRLVSQIPGATYVARAMVTGPKTINQAKKTLREAFQCQLSGQGFSLVELLSPCPTNWKMTPLQSCAWVETEMVEHYPPGLLVDRRPSSESQGDRP